MKTLTACALALALTTPLAAHAASAGDQAPTATVRYSDLNLTRSADAAVMLKRLDRAASSACGVSQFSLREVRVAVRQSDCYRDGMNQAVASLNSPTVTAIFKDRAGQLASN